MFPVPQTGLAYLRRVRFVFAQGDGTPPSCDNDPAMLERAPLDWTCPSRIYFEHLTFGMAEVC